MGFCWSLSQLSQSEGRVHPTSYFVGKNMCPQFIILLLSWQGLWIIEQNKTICKKISSFGHLQRKKCVYPSSNLTLLCECPLQLELLTVHLLFFASNCARHVCVRMCAFVSVCTQGSLIFCAYRSSQSCGLNWAQQLFVIILPPLLSFCLTFQHTAARGQGHCSCVYTQQINF